MEHTLQVGCLVVRAIGGKIGKGYQWEVEKFLNSNGPEWTSERLKSIWSAALHLRNGEPEMAISIYQRNSISYRYRQGFPVPRGNIGSAVLCFLGSSRGPSLRRWSALLRFYTGITLKEPSRRQMQKVRSSITSPRSVPSPSRAETVERDVVREWKRFLHNVRVPKIREHPTGDLLKGSTAYYSTKPFASSTRPKESFMARYGDEKADGLKERWYGYFINSLLTTQYLPDPIKGRLSMLPPDLLSMLGSKHSQWEGVGRITLLPEGGAKARPIATPNGWTQLAFFPLHEQLDRLQETLQESCVHNQLKGVRSILQAYEGGREVHSVDLSSATDRLPRSIQIEMIRELGHPDYAHALDEVSVGPWVLDYSGTQHILSYSVGQPMGLYGSFPLLNLTNVMVARSACVEVDGGLFNKRLNDFRVLGDDIVFFDRDLARAYIERMEALGVEVSLAKTFHGQVAQFAGFTVVPTNVGHAAFRPYKHPSEGFVTNPLEFLYAIGSKVRNLRNPGWEIAFRAFSSTLPKRELDLTPDLWIKELMEIPSHRHVEQAWISSLTNNLMRQRTSKMALQAYSHFEQSVARWIDQGYLTTSLFNLEQKSDFSIPQDPGNRAHRDEERVRDSHVYVPVRKIQSDPLMSQALEPKTIENPTDPHLQKLLLDVEKTKESRGLDHYKALIALEGYRSRSGNSSQVDRKPRSKSHER